MVTGQDANEVRYLSKFIDDQRDLIKRSEKAKIEVADNQDLLTLRCIQLSLIGLDLYISQCETLIKQARDRLAVLGGVSTLRL